jgi:pSer/pThr/pTyr-binding forkhead associated (FHA) protein
LCRDALARPPVVVLDQFPCDLGRGDDASVQINDRWLSRRHCRLVLEDGVLTVHDLGSRHGTFVNGQRISECKLLPGDELSIGLSKFVAEYDAPAVDSRPLALAGRVLPVLA